jgi:hypothetical protein
MWLGSENPFAVTFLVGGINNIAKRFIVLFFHVLFFIEPAEKRWQPVKWPDKQAATLSTIILLR